MKVNRVFLDVRGDRKEMLIDEGRDLIVSIGFGLQPNTRTSTGRCAEVEQQGLLFSLCLSECRIYVFVPLHSHFQNLLKTNQTCGANSYPSLHVLIYHATSALDGGAPDLMRS